MVRVSLSKKALDNLEKNGEVYFHSIMRWEEFRTMEEIWHKRQQITVGLGDKGVHFSCIVSMVEQIEIVHGEKQMFRIRGRIGLKKVCEFSDAELRINGWLSAEETPKDLWQGVILKKR